MKNNVYLNLIHLTFYEHQDWHGKHFKKDRNAASGRKRNQR